MSIISSKFSQIEKEKDILKRGYTDLKIKYMNSKLALKKCKEDQANLYSNQNETDKQKTQDTFESVELRKTQSDTTDIEIEKTEFNIKIKDLEDKLEEKTRRLEEQEDIFHEKMEKQKIELQEKEEELIEVIQEKQKIENLLNSFKDKRELALVEIQKLKKQLTDQEKVKDNTQSNKKVIQSLQSSDENSLNYNINPEKLETFLKNILAISSTMYKNFMIYVATSEETLMIQVETSINKLIELISEFYEYSTEKLKYLQKQKEKSMK